MVAVCLALGAVSAGLSTLHLSFVALGIGLALAGGTYTLFSAGGLWLNFTFPVLSILLTYSALTIYAYLTQDRRERMIRDAFDHYLHPAIVQSLCDNPDVLSLGGERKDLTVLFSDVRNFSSVASHLEPEQLVGTMNEYFNLVTNVVLENEGLLDKYLGDGLMAVYGAPLPTPVTDQAVQACGTALAMVEAATSLRESWAARGATQPLQIGVGINTGPMIIGNMGSDYHFDYTVMGDEVVIGSRLEQCNKILGTSIIASARTVDMARDRVAFRELDLAHIKGTAEPVRLFEVMGLRPVSDAMTNRIKVFEDGLAAYRRRDWAVARDRFAAALDSAPDDRPSAVFIRRCEFFAEVPPPDDWDLVAPERAAAGRPKRRTALDADPFTAAPGG